MRINLVNLASIILIFIFNYSCSDVHIQNTTTKEVTSSSNSIINSEDLLYQFKEIKFDSLFVFPDSLGNNPKYKFKGKPLEEKYYPIFKNIPLIQVGLADSVLSTSFRFPIGKNKVGLICETAGLDGSFAGVNLYIWDNNKITQGFILADKIGDAGGGYEFNSTIYKKGSELYEIIKRETTYQPNERADDEELTFNYKHSTSYWKITDSEISKIQ